VSTAVLTVGRTSYPLVLPSIRDSRLHVAAVIITIHVLGQVGLHFVISVWQILAAILTCAILEIAITFVQKKAFVWPASAMLTGSGVGLILRVVGTPPDDHWSTYAVGLFAAVAGLSLLTKYVIRYRGCPLFNPSNVGLVATFILLGSSRVEPLDFWWAPPNVWMVIAYTVILTGGLLITRRLRLISLAITFWATLAVGIGVLAASGHCITANWAFAPVCGFDFWRVVATSPEVFIFLFFMITDPRTVPASRVGRVAFGALVAAVGTLLLAPQTTEFGVKVGLLSGLTLVCAARPIFDRLLPRREAVEDDPRRYIADLVGLSRGASAPLRAARLGLATFGVAALTAGIIFAGGPARGAAASNEPPLADLDPSHMDPATFPSVTVDSAVTDWDPTLTGSTMLQIVMTSAQNLEIENNALLAADPSILTQVDHGDRLDEMQDRIRQSIATQTTRIDRYQPDSIEVTLLRPFGKQDGLSLGLKTQGTMIHETYDASGHLQDRSSAPFSLTFVVRRATGARWLNVAVLPTEVGQ
jgi:Na+-translocating ferredoxin:NAD+ oxidoreductase RnfD subunit